MFRRFLRATAWASIAIVVFGTLSGVRVVYAVYEKVAPVVAYPAISTYVHVEHVAAYLVVGALFCLAYPRSPVRVFCLLVAAAALLELLQMLTPDRHAELSDALEKIAGAAIGISLARLALVFVRPSRKSAAST